MSGMVPAIPMAAALDISQPEPTVVTVPAEMLRWSEYNPTQLRGVKKEWLNTLEEGTLVRLIIPAQATSIYKFYVAQDGFVDRLYSVDFTQATNLTDIDHSLFMDCKKTWIWWCRSDYSRSAQSRS